MGRRYPYISRPRCGEIRCTSVRNPTRTVYIIALLNAIALVVKILGGLLTGSMALLADGLDSVLNVVSLSLIRKYYVKSRKPPDESHHYGHYGYEAYASIMVIIIMTFLSSIVFMSVLLDLIEERSVNMILSPTAIYLALLSLAINGIAICMLSEWKEESIALRTEFRHISIDLFEASLVLVGVILAVYFSKIWDLMAALLISAFIFRSIGKSLTEVKSFIMDASPEPVIMKKIADIIGATKGVEGFHALRARKVGDRIFLDVHLTFKKGTPVEEAHEIASLVESKLMEAFNGKVDVVIHIEPSNASTL